MIILPIISCLILLLLAFIHVYWAFGGTKGIHAVIPQDDHHQRKFTPGKWATLLVALCLFSACLILGIQSSLIPFAGLANLARILCFFCFLVFGLRAIGDFNYVGLFKKRRKTFFFKMDTVAYTPLCLLLSFTFIYVFLTN
ncbi:DUF3995 domain-containing protein [Paenibacillus sp. J5C_2022]|uniref:DUF3995 domain-containing protein n=1 Tax=Paenibacillus sp. J5C2022 TaxID=2977129 RepID=UPI0021D347CA|nr:DUF3995 domain-containing protein [Paenibacillus sp. J5C2022]MCU6712719.1 DUF3995 domain-containing protein [Paenibacillus sp. J5C2022]